ncbi:MAG: prepilin-type N-terminal cleavage/methylation domain-containing protein [Desulfotignum sp.]|nr:prepilin-type N-terminal cleavage/methylation domain-containing protein [Desulfotignum sp.]
MDGSMKQAGFDQGFSLIEIMVALALISVVTAGIFISYSGQQKSELNQTQMVEMQQNIRAAIYLISRELRMAGYDPLRADIPGIVNPGDGSAGSPLTFSYIDPDDGSLTTVSYELYDAGSDGDNDIGRQRASDAAPRLLAENIQFLGFTYLDKDGAILSSPVAASSIRAVKIDITARPNAGSADHTIPGTVRSVSTMVYCRNLGL